MPLLAFRRHAACLFVAGALCLAAWPSAAQPTADDAARLIQGVSQKVIDLVKSKTGADRQAGIRQVLESEFDLAYMGRSALGTHWERTPEDLRERFLKAAAGAEARAYSERFGQYGGQTLALGRVASRPNGVFMVDSRLNQTSGEPIKIEWEVRDRGQGLRISDVKIEGVSMVMTRRSDFNSYIQQHGGKVDALVQELEARGARQ
ncbi:MAG: ABC transporter substrate-binding protein [Enhydrobacter sp.]|nr:MAG: ABC transporter substrate-binding protein [Enhydrobacter sp.]